MSNEYKPSNSSDNPQILSDSLQKSAAEATASEMLQLSGFRNRISENMTNRHQPHNAVTADERLEKRIAALENCIDRL